MINRALRPDGLWINLGPLRFHANQSRAYTIEEVLDVVGASQANGARVVQLTCHGLLNELWNLHKRTGEGNARWE